MIYQYSAKKKTLSATPPPAAAVAPTLSEGYRIA